MAVLSNQVLLEDPELDAVVQDYLQGKKSLDEAAAQVPKAKMSAFDYILKVLLPEDLYMRRMVKVTR
jgi:hypothetical protein